MTAMIVITMTNCPPRLRGDLTKWLQEIETGVFVGKLNARVREALWKRIAENTNSGRVTMVYSMKCAQGYEIRTLNTNWKPAEYDGITLMMHPLPPKKQPKVLQKSTPKKCKEKATKKLVDKKLSIKVQPEHVSDYVVIDIETTGLNAEVNEIIEMAAVHVTKHRVTESFECLIRPQCPLPSEITKLTGITDELLIQKGCSAKDAMKAFLQFIGDHSLVIHNAKFDLAFLKALSRKTELPMFSNEYYDTLLMSRERVRGLDNYRLATIANHFGIDIANAHRASADSMITMQLFEKLIEIKNG